MTAGLGSSTKTRPVLSARRGLVRHSTWCLTAPFSPRSGKRRRSELSERRFPPASNQTYGLGVQFPEKLAPVAEPLPGSTTDTLLFTDGSGRHPKEPNHRRCGCGIAGETTKLAYPLP
eukprot:3964230-Amphidinium_carterae.1